MKSQRTKLGLKVETKPAKKPASAINTQKLISNSKLDSFNRTSSSFQQESALRVDTECSHFQSTVGDFAVQQKIKKQRTQIIR